MRHGFSQMNCAKSAFVMALVLIVHGSATQVQAQYAPPFGYPAPVVAAPVYAYRPVTVFGGPAFAYPVPVAYTAPVMVPQAYVTYSNPAVYGPTAYGPGPAIVRDRVHVGLFGGVVHNYDVRGPGYNHLHLHARDGWLGHYDRVRYHY
jgi:hypothetical protein